ncbi:16S rRNA (cytidine(1402)-2'-O)-methyltransferase [Aquipuribacter sp. MA13-6]|uniref:16S rRNA (cytidine(1402)-2'-O)-methyltransferase n=1 Tax=unclassified Aquipuribacter TaxID=2635084 RepID=UPI003EEBF145
MLRGAYGRPVPVDDEPDLPTEAEAEAEAEGPAFGSAAPGGVVVVAATPIGDPHDASPRLRHWLATADVVAAEDTRRLRRLTRTLGVEVRGRVVAHHEHNETGDAAELLELVRAGRSVLVVTDAGMPTVSDPGFRLVAAAAEAGLAVTVVPGPSAVLAALAVSGLPTDRFAFDGFLPRKQGERGRVLEALRTEPRTTVLFEAPHRLADMLTHAAEVLGGDRRVAVCRELTKTYEEVRRGTLAELAAWARDATVLGEITVVLEGARPGPARTPEDLVAVVAQREQAGLRTKEAVAEVAAEHGVRKNALYDAVIAARRP